MKALNWNFSDSASLVFEDVDQRFSGIWHSFAGKARARVANSKFHGTLGGEASFDIEDSPDTFIELVFPVGAIVDEELPKMMADYSFPNVSDSNIRLSLKVRNSTSTSWGITVNPRSDVTIRDTDPLIVTLAIGEPWHRVTAQLDNLRAMLYEDRTWRVEDTSLRLIHVRTGRWSPIVGGDNTLVVKDSDLADNAFSWGNAKVVIENSTAAFLRAQDNVQMTVRDSTIKGDVVAVDNGRIILINTKVEGKTVTEGNGQIVKP